MNPVQRTAFRELIRSDGYQDPWLWLAAHWQHDPMAGLCGHCGHFSWTVRPREHWSPCPRCGDRYAFSSVLVLIGFEEGERHEHRPASSV